MAVYSLPSVLVEGTNCNVQLGNVLRYLYPPLLANWGRVNGCDRELTLVCVFGGKAAFLRQAGELIKVFLGDLCYGLFQ